MISKHVKVSKSKACQSRQNSAEAQEWGEVLLRKFLEQTEQINSICYFKHSTTTAHLFNSKSVNSHPLRSTIELPRILHLAQDFSEYCFIASWLEQCTTFDSLGDQKECYIYYFFIFVVFFSLV